MEILKNHKSKIFPLYIKNYRDDFRFLHGNYVVDVEKENFDIKTKDISIHEERKILQTITDENNLRFLDVDFEEREKSCSIEFEELKSDINLDS